MTGNAAWEGKLFEQSFQTGLVLTDVGIDFAVGAFQVSVANKSWSAVAGAGDINHVKVILLNHPVQVHVDKILPGRGAPVSQQARLDMLVTQRFSQQRIIEQINLADRKIIGRTP